MNTLRITTTTTPRCDVQDCPGYDEPLAGCANPAHDDATGGASPFFHTQRSGPAPCHGPLRRGRPRRLCGRDCETWVDNYYFLGVNGGYERAETTWLVMSREFRSYRKARRAVATLVATGVLPPGSPTAAFLLTPIKSIRHLRLDDTDLIDWESAS
jgi:hypothetical protein